MAALRQINENMGEIEDLQLEQMKKQSEVDMLDKQHGKLTASVTTKYEGAFSLSSSRFLHILAY